MKCPVCKTEELLLSELETHLMSRHCSKCNGNWIPSFEYWKWRELVRESLPQKEATPSSPNPSTGVLVAKICPECRGILIRYKVGHGFSFSIDQCGNCRGVWFDKDEWEALRSRNLHDDVYTIFTGPWQAQVRKQEADRNQEQIYVKKFGKEGFEEVIRMKEWIEAHPFKQEIIAYLIHQ
jgi:Zn-finger nucleic acid-binding protein